MIPPLRDRPIRQKLLWTSGLASSIALVLACAAFVFHERVTFPASFGRELGIQAEIIGRNSAAALLFSDPTSAASTLEALSARQSILAAAIYTSAGRRFASYPAAPPEGVLPEVWPKDAPDSSQEANRVTVRKPIVFQGDTIGSVVIHADLREMNVRMTEYGLIALVVLGISLLAAFAISARLQRTISSPILHLTEVAREISERKDYSVRAHAISGDEIGFLVQTFNQMLDHIQRRERELEKALEGALESARLKSAFLANMSHEIRTPLNIILGYNELIESTMTEKGAGSPDDLAAFDSIKRAGRRLIETIDGILDISRIETGAFEVNRVAISITEIVQRCVEDFQILAERKGLALRCDIEEPDVVVLFDQHCLSHALINLVSNAIKFTDQGGVTVRLARSKEGSLELSVADTGVGIAEAFLPRLFEPFSQEDPSTTRRFEGSGLGLALVKSYAELNGAGVSVVSKKGQGSTFVIRFPRESEVKEPARGRGSSGRGESVSPSAETSRPITDKPTVLVVEDDPDSQGYMKTSLRGSYDVILAGSADEARRALAFHGRRIRLILMDVALHGGEDGLALTRSLRREEQWRRIPIIATTALALPEDRRKAYDAGCAAYLAKPMNRQALLRVMSELLAHDEAPLPQVG